MTGSFGEATEEERAQVAAGAAWLDEQRPGWWRQITLGRLDQTSDRDCILGQLYGDYWAAPLPGGHSTAAALDTRYRAAVAFGFDGPRNALRLEGAWRDLITARRAAAGDDIEGGGETDDPSIAGAASDGG